MTVGPPLDPPPRIPPPGVGRPALVSPILLAPELPPEASQALLTRGDQRVVLVELRLTPGTPASGVRDDFMHLFDRVFGKSAMRGRRPVPIARNYVRCTLTPTEIDRLANGDGTKSGGTSADAARGIIYRVWPDLVVEAHLDRSLATIQADAAFRTFNCGGSGIVWGVLDSGIDAKHLHFAENKTLTSSAVDTLHCDFTPNAGPDKVASALTDPYGHGTHVAGIIAGQSPNDQSTLRIAELEPTVDGFPHWTRRELESGSTLSGVAPAAKLVSLRVLDENGTALQSSVIAALDYVRNVNDGGRDLQIHGLNLSLGCKWQPNDYAAGQSPLCRELDLLVGTGVVVVVSAGNNGAGIVGAPVAPTVAVGITEVYGQLSSITDPGNSAGAITVGSVHRYKPHTFGVTYNSSKGPTLDGRTKPDLVAPGERITSAAPFVKAQKLDVLEPDSPTELARYYEESGTSMAAAHVSGVIAGFLSTRTEFIGQPQQVKKIIVDTATDLGRHQFFQGGGLINLLRALTST